MSQPPNSSPSFNTKGKMRESPTLSKDSPLPVLPRSRSKTPPSPPSPSSKPSSSSVPKIPPRVPTEDPKTPPPADKGKGKRKAHEIDLETTPPDVKKEKQASDGSSKPHRATFVDEPRPHRASATSGSSHAPSSYQRKRTKLSSSTYTASSAAGGMAPVGEAGAAGPSRPTSRQDNFHITGGSSRMSSWGHNPFRTQSRNSQPPGSRPNSPPVREGARLPRSSSRRSVRSVTHSQVSIPISALISPHAPSVSLHRSSVFHMRDPRKPPRLQPTPWSLSFPTANDGQAPFFSRYTWKVLFSRIRGRDGDEDKTTEHVGWTEGGGSPLHAWFFFIGFILFPVWWIAGFLIRIPKTRRIDVEKGAHGGGVVLDDPQIEFDAKSWRKRCRIMAAVSLFTYLPFIVLVAHFAPRH